MMLVLLARFSVVRIKIPKRVVIVVCTMRKVSKVLLTFTSVVILN